MARRVGEGVSAVAMAMGSVERAREVGPTPITTGSESCSYLSMHELILIPHGLFSPPPPCCIFGRRRPIRGARIIHTRNGAHA